MAASTQVVVVGAGPTGLLAACELARRGVSVRLVDKLTAPTEQSRAIVVHARSLEMLDRAGVAGEIIGSGVKTLGMRMYAAGRQLAHIDLSRAGVDSAFPFSVMIAQTETERILAQRLRTLGGSPERGVELTGLTQDADQVRLVLRHQDGSTEHAETSFVVAADGAHSTARGLVGTHLAGSFRGERFILGDVEADHSLDPSSIHTYFAPDGPLLAFPMVGSRLRIVAQVHTAPDQPVNLNPGQADLQRIADDRAGGIRITRSHWLTEFEIHHGQVPAYRFGRVFLAGDAAHIHSPAGGQGMNTGMQDAFNLAWKLALAVAGRGGQTLLDSYHAERHPVAAAVIRFSSAMTRAGTVRGGLPIRLRNAMVHMVAGIPVIQRAMTANTEETTVAYPGTPVPPPRPPACSASIRRPGRTTWAALQIPASPADPAVRSGDQQARGMALIGSPPSPGSGGAAAFADGTSTVARPAGHTGTTAASPQAGEVFVTARTELHRRSCRGLQCTGRGWRPGFGS